MKTLSNFDMVSAASRLGHCIKEIGLKSMLWRLLPTPDKFYKKESQEKTLPQRPDFFLLPSPHD
jgi:hypothetical protein